MIPDAEAAAPEWAERLRSWQQGDYCLDVRQVLVVDGIENGDLVPAAGDALGFAVITQTCDIVNWGPGKEWVVVAPLVEASERLIDNVRRGTTPAFAPLERPPSSEVVVDLNQAMTLHKSLLASLTRLAGFETDGARSRFADAIGRKYGRFAFPDPFADNVLRALRTKLHKSHGKDSEQGRTYASIDSIRVVPQPRRGRAVTSGRVPVRAGARIPQEGRSRGDERRAWQAAGRNRLAGRFPARGSAVHAHDRGGNDRSRVA